MSSTSSRSYGIPGSLVPHDHDHPISSLSRADARLQFPPSYVIVGVYRLCTDKNLYVPAWQKCKHGIVRGLAVGGIWSFFTFAIQRKFIELFLLNSPRVTGLSSETILGYKLPFNLATYATIVFLSSQVTAMLTFFLSRNIGIARTRAYDQTVASRGKGPEFWGPYVEEWDKPPVIQKRKGWGKVVGTVESIGAHWAGRFIVKRVLLLPFSFVPFLGLLITAYLKALGTAKYLHKPYFEAKKMTRDQVSTFIEERKWDYRAFGFAASLLEGLPIIGLAFTVSNRVGAAMWAHDLEKHQHDVANRKRLGPGSDIPMQDLSPRAKHD
ncbi:hypothetical protein JAAARDRAFT_35040 [Jaapia argillacea MUCL 33604]|uniref:Uncharacterized protein n=1 Tax=Jaapia argillacea MUCL 33604 TaxID=933084 RepID=A0A067PWI7_9AGAM|nr:hypothetical protein JAAARDRAFT_35040 [Jaapia argillacea MUCL 33604]